MKGEYMHISKKSILIPALAIVVGTGVVALSAQAVQAATQPNVQSLSQRIAEKFGLQQSEVDAVVGEFRAERQAEMETRFEERLATLVSEGKITEAQKAAILAKHEELQAKRQSLEALSPEERKAQMDALRDEMKAWAESQGIDAQIVFGMMGPGRGGHNHMMWGEGAPNN